MFFKMYRIMPPMNIFINDVAPADQYSKCVSATPQSLFAKDFARDYKIVKGH